MCSGGRTVNPDSRDGACEPGEAMLAPKSGCPENFGADRVRSWRSRGVVKRGWARPDDGSQRIETASVREREWARSSEENEAARKRDEEDGERTEAREEA